MGILIATSIEVDKPALNLHPPLLVVDTSG
jgi:hypothetical protein